MLYNIFFDLVQRKPWIRRICLIWYLCTVHGNRPTFPNSHNAIFHLTQNNLGSFLALCTHDLHKKLLIIVFSLGSFYWHMRCVDSSISWNDTVIKIFIWRLYRHIYKKSRLKILDLKYPNKNSEKFVAFLFLLSVISTDWIISNFRFFSSFLSGNQHG